MQLKKQQLEPDMEQQTCSKLEKVFIKAVYFTGSDSSASEIGSETGGSQMHHILLQTNQTVVTVHFLRSPN